MQGMTTKRTKPHVADEIRRAIRRGDKTRYAISAETGVDQGQLCRFMAGWSLGVDKLEAVARSLGLEIVVRPAKCKSKGG